MDTLIVKYYLFAQEFQDAKAVSLTKANVAQKTNLAPGERVTVPMILNAKVT